MIWHKKNYVEAGKNWESHQSAKISFGIMFPHLIIYSTYDKTIQRIRRGNLCVRTKIRHDSIMGITAWAEQYFQKSLSVNTVDCSIHKFRNLIQKHCHLV